jgi:hypothetical protein
MMKSMILFVFKVPVILFLITGTGKCTEPLGPRSELISEINECK